MYRTALQNKEKIFSVAPMMDWTDRHCRFFHRQLSAHALLYTEMVVADAIIHGDRDRHLAYDDAEHPIALQLGGSEPDKLIKAVTIANDYHYDEINLNVGCPSDRVQSGTFGACLMREPQLVADCVSAMKSVTQTPITVKCRIGVDDQEPREALFTLAEKCVAAGVDALWVHARKAWLKGLSPKENRDIPPLDYAIVSELKRSYPDMFIGINGGIDTLEKALPFLKDLDGVMIGRAAYQNPTILLGVDHAVYGAATASSTPYSTPYSSIDRVIDQMALYAERHITQGGRLHHITRHMIGLGQGREGARRYRQILSTEGVKKDATPETLYKAYAALGENVHKAA